MLLLLNAPPPLPSFQCQRAKRQYKLIILRERGLLRCAHSAGVALGCAHIAQAFGRLCFAFDSFRLKPERRHRCEMDYSQRQLLPARRQASSPFYLPCSGAGRHNCSICTRPRQQRSYAIKCPEMLAFQVASAQLRRK